MGAAIANFLDALLQSSVTAGIAIAALSIPAFMLGRKFGTKVGYGQISDIRIELWWLPWPDDLMRGLDAKRRAGKAWARAALAVVVACVQE